MKVMGRSIPRLMIPRDWYCSFTWRLKCKFSRRNPFFVEFTLGVSGFLLSCPLWQTMNGSGQKKSKYLSIMGYLSGSIINCSIIRFQKGMSCIDSSCPSWFNMIQPPVPMKNYSPVGLGTPPVDFNYPILPLFQQFFPPHVQLSSEFPNYMVVHPIITLLYPTEIPSDDNVWYWNILKQSTIKSY